METEGNNGEVKDEREQPAKLINSNSAGGGRRRRGKIMYISKRTTIRVERN